MSVPILPQDTISKCLPRKLKVGHCCGHGSDAGEFSHLLQHLQILDDQLSGGTHTHCLRLVQGRVHPAEHSQHKARGLAAAIVRLQLISAALLPLMPLCWLWVEGPYCGAEVPEL